jgi:hypothetical protein
MAEGKIFIFCLMYLAIFTTYLTLVTGTDNSIYYEPDGNFLSDAANFLCEIISIMTFQVDEQYLPGIWKFLFCGVFDLALIYSLISLVKIGG